MASVREMMQIRDTERSAWIALYVRGQHRLFLRLVSDLDRDGVHLRKVVGELASVGANTGLLRCAKIEEVFSDLSGIRARVCLTNEGRPEAPGESVVLGFGPQEFTVLTE